MLTLLKPWDVVLPQVSQVDSLKDATVAASSLKMRGALESRGREMMRVATEPTLVLGHSSFTDYEKIPRTP